MYLGESSEMYLETIYLLQNRTGYVRSIDIVNEMAFSKPSVSRAMGLLRENGYITMEPGGRILLTERGHAVAEQMYDRHTHLTRFLISLGVEANIAEQDACRMEHILSQESFEKLKQFVNDQEQGAAAQ